MGIDLKYDVYIESDCVIKVKRIAIYLSIFILSEKVNETKVCLK